MKLFKYFLSYKDFFKSTTIVLTNSGLVGLSFTLLDKPFWPAFILATCTQYLAFGVLVSIVSQYLQSKVRLAELDSLEPLSTILQCASCTTPNVTTFVPDQQERVEFVCDKCEGKNVVSINFTVARVTEFIEPIQVSQNIGNMIPTQQFKN